MDLPLEYGVHDTFNVIDLSPFVGTNDDDELDLRTNPFQGGGDDGGGPSTPTQGSQGTSQGERLDQDQDQGERLGRESKRLGREGERLDREGGRLSMELDRLGPLTRSMAKHIQTQANEATDGREKALYMFA